MACLLPRMHGWLVTGTPFERGLYHSLRTVADFLEVEPFYHAGTLRDITNAWMRQQDEALHLIRGDLQLVVFAGALCVCDFTFVSPDFCRLRTSGFYWHVLLVRVSLPCWR